MKTILLLTLAISALSSITNAASVTLSTGYYNKYLAFGTAGTLHDKPVIQSFINVAFDNGFYCELWNSYSPDGALNLGDELDYKVGWSGKIGKGWSGDFSATYFDEPNISSFSSGDIWYLAAKVMRPIGDFTLGFEVGNYIPTGNSAFEGGWLIGPTLCRNFQMNEKLSVFCKASLLYDDGGFGLSNGFVFNTFTSIDYKVTEHLSWNVVQSTLYIPINISDYRKTDIVWGSGFKYQF